MQIFLLVVAIIVFIVFGILQNIANYYEVKKQNKLGGTLEGYGRFYVFGMLIPFTALSYIIYYFFGW